jgi:hypothetical protein
VCVKLVPKVLVHDQIGNRVEVYTDILEKTGEELDKAWLMQRVLKLKDETSSRRRVCLHVILQSEDSVDCVLQH